MLPVLLCVAFLTLLERKILRIVGYRLGPSKISVMGFLQPLTDAAKLMNKQVNILSNFSYFFYYARSILTFVFSLILWFTVSGFTGVSFFKFTLLVFIIVLGFNSLNSIFCGWRTFGKFSLIGSIRTVCQLISYEASLYLCVFFLLVILFSYNFLDFSTFSPFCSFLFFPFTFII